MAELDDLKAAIQAGADANQALATATQNEANELAAVAAALVALKGQNPINPADVEAAAQQVAAQATAVQAIATAAQAAADAAKGSTGV